MLTAAKSSSPNKLTQPFITSAFKKTEKSAVPPVGGYNTCQGLAFEGYVVRPERSAAAHV